MVGSSQVLIDLEMTWFYPAMCTHLEPLEECPFTSGSGGKAPLGETTVGRSHSGGEYLGLLGKLSDCPSLCSQAGRAS